MSSIFKHFARDGGNLENSNIIDNVTHIPAVTSSSNTLSNTLFVSANQIPSKWVLGTLCVVGIGVLGYRTYKQRSCNDTDILVKDRTVVAEASTNNTNNREYKNEKDGTKRSTYERVWNTISANTISRSILPSIFQRTFLYATSHELATKSSQATTIVLEQQGHKWFQTICDLSTQQAIVGLTVHVPATVVVAQNVYTVNRWLDVEVRRKPLVSNSRVSVWNDVLKGIYDNHSEDLDANRYIRLIRQSVQNQFEQIDHPVPTFKINVQNRLCDKSHGDYYGLHTASHISGILAGLILSFTNDTIMYDSLNSLSTVVGDLCVRQHAGEHNSDTNEVQSRLIRERIVAALWETEVDNDSDIESDNDNVKCINKTSTKHDNVDDDRVDDNRADDGAALVAVSGHIQKTESSQNQPFIDPYETRISKIIDLFSQHNVHVDASNIQLTDDDVITIITSKKNAVLVQNSLEQICEEYKYIFVDHGLMRVQKSTALSDQLQQTWISSVDVIS